MDGVQAQPVAAAVTRHRPLRIGLVGAGLAGQAGHAITLAEDRERFQFVAVVDASPTVRAAVAARYGIPRAAASLAEALHEELDAVVIAVPDAGHRDACLEALRAGLHVFCEKPLATSLEEVDEIIAARGDRVLQCGYMKLYDPAVERMLERLRDPPAELIYLSVEVNDPDQGPFVDHLGLVTAADLDPGLIAQSRVRASEAVARALGRAAAPDEARAFEAYLGALVHDVSLAHHLLASLGIPAPLPLADAAYFDAGRGVSIAWTLPGGARAHLTHLNLPAVPHYRERVTAYCRDRILELTFPSPYLRHFPTRLIERRAAAPPGGTVAATGGEATELPSTELPSTELPSTELPSIELRSTEYRVSYEESFRNELRAFHASITLGAPVRAGAEAARDDLQALLGAVRRATGVDHLTS